jgi:DAK2 domain fusion protein YloV
VLDRLDAAAVHRWAAAGLDGLRRHQREINDLNVYPVPDSDTGTNLVLTWAAGHAALAGHTDGLAQTLAALAHGVLLGAQGNSGGILAQLLKGLAQSLAGVSEADGRALAQALVHAAREAREAVSAPVEGTVLSVADAAGRAAVEADSADLAAVVRAAARAAGRALARTPEQLPVLARAGVVDAGGRGWCVLLDALVEVVTGEPAPAPPPVAAPVVRETGSPGYAYEVQYLLDAPAEAIAALRATLSGLGDSLVVVGGPTWNVHVHVNDVGAAIEAGIVAGRPHRISVTRFADQHRPARGAVVVVSGPGLADVVHRAGGIPVSGPDPSAADLLEAVRKTGAEQVVVFPSGPAAQAAAAVATGQARAEGIRVAVVPTRSAVQALAALAIQDPARRFEDELIAMAEAAGACRCAEVTRAAREAVTVVGVCRPGDILGLVEGEVNLIGAELMPTCRDLLDRLLSGGGELVTLMTGEDAPGDLAGQLREHLAQRWPFVEVQVIAGGQPRYPLVLGVE